MAEGPRQLAGAGPLILTLDVGSSSLRARLFDAQGRDLPALDVRVGYTLQTMPDGGAELDPGALFEAVCQALDQLLADAGALTSSIGGVAISMLAANMLGLDEAGQPVTPLYTYADMRGEDAAAALRGRLDEQALFQRTGCPLRASYMPALLLWLSQAQPERFGRVRRWLSFGDYLLLQLFGSTATSQSMAAWSGMLNRQSGDWDAELLAALPLRRAQLPPVAREGQRWSGLRPPWARRWPALAQVPWLPAVGDGVCSNVGSGCIGARHAALAVGTSGALRLLLDQPVQQIPWGLWAYRVDSRRTLLGGSLNNGGNVVAWLRQTLALGEAQELDTLLAGQEPAAHGLTVLPFLAGERAPTWEAGARAAVVGLGLSTTPAQLLQAWLEAVAYRFALLLRLLDGLCDHPPTLRASGGAMTSSPAWVQLMADVLGRPVTLADGEVSSRGAALLALETLGLLDDLAALPVPAGRVFEPDPARHARYQHGLERHLELCRQLGYREA